MFWYKANTESQIIESGQHKTTNTETRGQSNCAWYQRGTLQYVGMQTGLGFFGAGSGLFAQQGPSGSFTGINYDGWISYVAGFSVRKFKPWGADFGATSADLSIFGFYPLKIDTKGEALF